VLLATLLLALTAQGPGAAVEMDVTPEETRFGRATAVTGRLTDGVVGQTVRLEGRRYPYDGDFRVLESTLTGADGSFAFRREFERNWQVRVRAGDAVAPAERVYVFPRFTLRYRARNERVIRLVQRYGVPHGVELRRPTVFYVGRRGARTAPRAARARVERTASGRYKSTAVVRIPARWNGRFRYASCFGYTPGSGMGDPRARCPKRFRF
jgi:hypothetical protein